MTETTTREDQRISTDEPLCHSYYQLTIRFDDMWTRYCDGVKLTFEQAKASKPKGHPHSCTKCVVCDDKAKRMGLSHDAGIVYGYGDPSR